MDEEEQFRERQQVAADATMSKRATPSEVSAEIAAAVLRSTSSNDTMRSLLSAYGKRKKIEMERYGTPVEYMRERYEKMRAWCQGVLEISARHSGKKKSDALDALRRTMFGVRFDDVGRTDGRAVFEQSKSNQGLRDPKGTTPHCPECNDGGLVYKEIEFAHEKKIGIGLCHCGFGAKRREAIETSERGKPKKKRGEDFK